MQTASIPVPGTMKALLSKLKRGLTALAGGGAPESSSGRGRPPKPQGPDGVRELGHREYVGGLWSTLGRLQFDFLVERGLRPRHRLLDLGCGALRAGVLFIPYLEPGHYMGLEKERLLLERGVREELGRALYELKRPQLVASADFDVGRFEGRPDYAIAHSLFTHLPEPDIARCLSRVRSIIAPGGELYATFFETARPRSNPSEPHDHRSFLYTVDEMRELGREAGWDTEYLGDWGHPRDQMMLLFRPG